MATPLLRPSLALSGLLLALGACAEDPEPTTNLVIEVRHSAEEGWESYTLTCDPEGGSHPTADDACRTLTDLEPADLRRDPDKACAQIYGGPQEAKVRGLLHGDEIDETFSRTDACETTRWDKLGEDVLPVDPDWQN